MLILRASAMVVLASLALVAAGCGGSKSPSVASLGPPTTTTGGDTGPTSSSSDHPSTAKLLKFVHCMQRHGVQVQVENGGRGIRVNSDPGGGKLDAAQKACEKLLPGGGPKSMTPAQRARMMKQLVDLAKCMRKHGVPDFPDPTPDGGLQLKKSGSLNPASPQFQSAIKACNAGGPGGKGFAFKAGPS